MRNPRLLDGTSGWFAASSRVSTRGCELIENRVGLAEAGCQDLAGGLQELEDAWVSHGVVDARPVATAIENAVFAQYAEMLGGSARIHLQLALQFAHGALAVFEQLEDPYSHGVAEDAEELRLDLVDGAVLHCLGRAFACWRGGHSSTLSGFNVLATLTDDGLLRLLPSLCSIS